MATQTLEFVDYTRTDFDTMANELADMESLSQKEALRVEIDSGLENALKELESLQTQLPKERAENLLELCKSNVLQTIEGQFGLASLVITTKDGGNVTTKHNFEKGITANAKDEEKSQIFHKKQQDSGYQRNDGACNYDEGKDKMRDSSDKRVFSEYSNEVLDRGSGKGKAQLDHVNPIKKLDEDPKAHLFLTPEQRAELANIKENLQWLEASANASKSDRDLMEWGRDINKKTGKTNFETYNIDEKRAEKIYKRAKAAQDNVILKAELKKYSKELVTTGAYDAVKMATYCAFGMILKELVQGIIIECRQTLKEKGNENFKQIFTRFRKRLDEIMKNIKDNWKDIFDKSIEQGIMAFLSNIVVFVINLFFTTLKRFVMIIRSGFVSICDAVKILANPPKDMPKDEIGLAAVKILTTGLIGAFSLGLAESIEKLLLSVPALMPIMAFPVPLINEFVGTILSTTLSAVVGGILSTIAIYYMDKWINQNKTDKLQIQIMTKSGEIVNLKIMQTWLLCGDAFENLAHIARERDKSIKQTRQEIQNSQKQADEALNSYQKTFEKFKNLQKGN